MALVGMSNQKRRREGTWPGECEVRPLLLDGGGGGFGSEPSGSLGGPVVCVVQFHFLAGYQGAAASEFADPGSGTGLRPGHRPASAGAEAVEKRPYQLRDMVHVAAFPRKHPKITRRRAKHLPVKSRPVLFCRIELDPRCRECLGKIFPLRGQPACKP